MTFQLDTSGACADCVCDGTCRFVSPTEQPYFQAYRLANRIALGEPWRGFEFIIWIGRQWAAWRPMVGLDRFAPISPEQRAAFEGWLFARTGHPASGEA